MLRDIKICVIVLLFMISTWWINEINGALQENVAFYSEHGVHDPEMAILMDMSDGAKINGMDNHIAQTVKRWITYSMPEGDAIGVAQIGTSNFIHIPMTVVGDISQRNALASKIKPIVHGESNPLKGIHLAEKLFSKEGGFIVLIGYQEWDEVYIGTNEKKTLSNVLEKNLKVVNIFLQTNTSLCAFSEHNSYVQFLQVSENSLHVQHEMRIINIDTALEEIMAVYSSDWGHNDLSTTVILQKDILIDHKSDDTVNISITVFSCSQFRRLEISVHLFCGWNMCQLSHDLPECNEAWNGTDTELNTLWISYPCNVNGTWTLTLTCPKTNEKTNVNNAFIRVAEVCAFEKDRSDKPVKFNCLACKDWKTQAWSGNKLELENSLCAYGDSHVTSNGVGPQPVIIMSYIEENNQPMENITIMVTAEDVSNQRNKSKNKKEILELHDGGWRADGINKNKIHSGYFSPTGDFYYHCRNGSLQCNISLTCTASGYGLITGKFQIQIRGPPFQTADEPYHPDKIRDLRGEQEGTSNINLTWTAAGRPWGKGKVLEYALQFKSDCKGNSSITNGHQEDEIYENRRNKSIHFNLPSTPGELTYYSVTLEDIMGKTRLSQVYKVCFFLEAIRESQKKTPSNCACTTLKYKTDKPYPPDKITDLRGEQEGTSSIINLTWTAARRSLGYGKAFEYALQFKNDCNDNSSITNGHQEDEIYENRRNNSIHFNLPSTPGESANYRVILEDIMGKTRLSQVFEVCFFLEAIGESQKKTPSNCACTTVKYESNSFNVPLVAIILLAASVPTILILAIFLMKWKRKSRRCFHVFQRNIGENISDPPAYFDGRLVKLTNPESQPLQGNE